MPVPARLRRLVVPAALAALLPLAACTGDAPPDTQPLDTQAATPAPADLRPFYEQRVRWRDCRSDMQCTEIEVPLDYAAPEEKRIRLSVLKVPAKDPDSRIGSLVVNPGGPGVSGVEYAANAGTQFGADVLAVYDVVGFDPRGVGASTPVDCVSDAQLDALVASDPDPDTAEEARLSTRMMRAFGEGCVRRSGDLAGHVSTEEAARDMDILREVLGQARMVYFGASYGTLLGATYADLFPGRVGRLVLDGAVDPTLTSLEYTLGQARGFETAFTAYVEHCVGEGRCYLGDEVAEAKTTVAGFMERLDADPIRVGDRRLTEGNALYGIFLPLYNRDYWRLLDSALEDALAGDGRALLTLSDAYVSRGQDGYVDNSIEALYAINCLDNPEGLAPRQVGRYEEQFEEASPTFGRVFAFSLTGCRDWPVSDGKWPRELSATGAPPIVVIGTTRDPATPFEWAEGLARQLDSGVLVRRDGDGHTGYLAGNDCVDEVVETYLLTGTAPGSTVEC